MLFMPLQARPKLKRGLEHRNFDSFVDSRLQGHYYQDEMACMVACAAACVRHLAHHRPRMGQVITFK